MRTHIFGQYSLEHNEIFLSCQVTQIKKHKLTRLLQFSDQKQTSILLVPQIVTMKDAHNAPYHVQI